MSGKWPMRRGTRWRENRKKVPLKTAAGAISPLTRKMMRSRGTFRVLWRSARSGGRGGQGRPILLFPDTRPLVELAISSCRYQVAMNLSNCKYEVLRIVLGNLGWKEVGDEDEWDAYWTDTSIGGWLRSAPLCGIGASLIPCPQAWTG